MSAEATGPIEAAPVVAARIDQSESALLRELVGESGSYREAGMEDVKILPRLLRWARQVT